MIGGSNIAHNETQLTDNDLEQVEGEKALQWVKLQNAKTSLFFEEMPCFEDIQRDTLQILESPDKIAYPTVLNDYYYNFWRDEHHVRGLLRRTTEEEYLKDNPTWETVLDVDALAEAERENWTYQGSVKLMPDANRVLIALAKGGTDAKIYREFDMVSKQFVEDGFYIPEAKSRVCWLDQDTILIASDFGEGSLTQSGYPCEAKILKRGQRFEDAEPFFKGKQTDVSLFVSTSVRPESQYLTVTRSTTFFEQEYYIANLSKGETLLKQLPIPKDASLEDYFKGYALISLKSDWKVGGNVYPQGSFVSLDLASIANKKLGVELIMSPSERVSIQGASACKNHVLVSVSNNVCSELYSITRAESGWERTRVALPEKGTLSVISASDFSDDFLVNYEGFLKPSTLYMCDNPTSVPVPIKAAPSHFNSNDMVVNQFEAVSTDGEKIPYFIMHHKDIKPDSSNPTLLYAYGGFEVSMNPHYLSTIGKNWLEKGGIYVIANIRGGGEFGPQWHQAGLKENRQQVYDDFFAVAEKLISDKVTSPKKLAIQGGSNGGLLMGVAFTQRPDLFNAVVCQVPLLDMLQYHKLSAGASWVDEYGDPEDPRMRDIISRYSPYQNVSADKSYPEVFFMTSTKDDRVHPSHARKMVHKMQEQGHHVHYFETIEGGHSAAANLKQRAYNYALTMSYLMHKLFGLAPKKKVEVDLVSNLTEPLLLSAASRSSSASDSEDSQIDKKSKRRQQKGI